VKENLGSGGSVGNVSSLFWRAIRRGWEIWGAAGSKVHGDAGECDTGEFLMPLTALLLPPLPPICWFTISRPADLLVHNLKTNDIIYSRRNSRPNNTLHLWQFLHKLLRDLRFLILHGIPHRSQIRCSRHRGRCERRRNYTRQTASSVSMTSTLAIKAAGT
jgi:hypothetical protein